VPSPEPGDHPDSLEQLRRLPFVFVDDLESPRLNRDDHHHLGRVRRISEGDTVAIGDGAGHWRVAGFGEAPDPRGPIIGRPRRSPHLTIGFTPVKGERPEWVVQKLTELGIDRIMPMSTDRSVVRWDADRAVKNVAKWRLVVREAAMQSRQLWLPRIDEVRPLADVRSELPAALLADPAGSPLGDLLLGSGAGEDAAPVAAILIGPEGGWSPEEVADRPACSLPGGVLRAETAALVAATLLVEFADRSARRSR
jgi:16S rRNA (uracil1498-N3)-methyltransferase